MPVSSVELWWGVNSPQKDIMPIAANSHRTRLEPALRQVIDVATAGMQALGIELTETKRATFWQVPCNFILAGEATSKSTAHMYLTESEIKGRMDVGWRNRGLVHELVHNVRMERFNENTAGEIAATEGLAYHSANLFPNPTPMWRSRGAPSVERVKQMPQAIVKILQADFAEAMEYDASNSPQGEQWLRYANKKTSLRQAEIVGISAVAAQLEAGYTIADLIHLPAAQVLGYETAA